MSTAPDTDMTVRTEAFRITEGASMGPGIVAVFWRYAMAKQGGTEAQVIRCTLSEGTMELHPETPRHMPPEEALKFMLALEEKCKSEHPGVDMSKRDLPSYQNAVPVSECFNRLFDAGMTLKTNVAPMKTLKIRSVTTP